MCCHIYQHVKTQVGCPEIYEYGLFCKYSYNLYGVFNYIYCLRFLQHQFCSIKTSCNFAAPYNIMRTTVILMQKQKITIKIPGKQK